MAIGIVSDNDFEMELARVVQHNGPGRNGAPEVPAELRELIAEEKISGTPASELVKSFGVSSASVSAYANGATSTATYNKPDARLTKHNNEFRDKISGIATSKLMAALNHITEDNLSKVKPRDLAGIAKDMSTVVNNMNPQAATGVNAQFIFHSYPNRKEEDYESIDVIDVR